MRPPPVRLWFWFDDGFACGALATDGGGIIVDGAPIFLKWRGHHLNDHVRRLRVRGHRPRWTCLQDTEPPRT